MTFGNPRGLTLLLILAVATILTVAYTRLLKARFESWIESRLWHRVMPEYSRRIRIARATTLFAGLFFLALGVARPQWGQHEELIESRGMDILFLLDLSNSMLAEDTPPSRLSRAQLLIRNVLKNLGEDRAGVISFAGKAFLTVPLTNDFEYVVEMTDTLDPAHMASQGTDLGQAITVAIRAFERSGEDPHKQSRAVIVISDGEDFGDTAIKAAEKLKEFGTNFFTLSVGSAEGAPIPVRGPSGILQTYKKDSRQKPVLTRVNRELLAKVAEAGGGTHLELVNPEDTAFTLIKTLKSAQRTLNNSRLEVVRIERFQIFIGFAILCFMIHMTAGYRRKKGTLPGTLALLLVLGLLSGTDNADAESMGSYWNARKAQNRYQKGRFEDSAKAYEEARRSDQENPLLQFNEGTAIARSQKKEEALLLLQEATRKALISGDFETAARSLYNEGVLLNESKARTEAYDRLTKSIELAKRTGLKDVEERARKALAQSFQQQQQQPKEKSDGKDGGQDQQKKDGGQGESGKNPSQPKPEEGGKNRQFRGATLSKDVAESLMNDLSDREKQLHQRRLDNRKPKESPHDKDW